MAASTPTNPYIAGPALSDEHSFFGRVDILREIETALHHSTYNTIILYGQPRIGKTSLLLQLQRRLPASSFAAIYFDLADKTHLPVDQVFYKLASTVTTQLDLPAPSAADFTNNPTAFHRLFLPSLYQALGHERRPIFLLDEFNLQNIKIEDLPETAAVRAMRYYLHQVVMTDSRSAFIFTAGQWLEQLSLIANATHETRLARPISLLPYEEARALILQAEHKGYLRYTDAAVERILALTGGQPYLTQLTCQSIFNKMIPQYRSNQQPVVTVAEVESVLPTVLAEGTKVYQQIWAALPSVKRPGFGSTSTPELAQGGGQALLEAEMPSQPGATPRWLGAERIILAAMAGQVKEGAGFSQADITTALQKAGIRPDVKELEQAPQNLVEWGVFEKANGGYRFRVELLRRWMAEHQPIDQVKKDELASLSPAATALYQAAQAAHQTGNDRQAADQLRQTLAINPNHVQAQALLGQILQDEKQTTEAVTEIAPIPDQATAETGESDKKEPKRARLWPVVAIIALLLLLLLCGWAITRIPNLTTPVAATTVAAQTDTSTQQATTATEAANGTGQTTPSSDSSGDENGTDGDENGTDGGGSGTDSDENGTDGNGTDGDENGTDGDGNGTDGDGNGTDGDGNGTDGDGNGTDGDGNGTDSTIPATSEPTTEPATDELTGTIRIAGSTTMRPLIAELAQAFTTRNPDVQIDFETGNSDAGIEAAGQGAIEIGLAARDIESADLAPFRNLKVSTLGRDVIVIATHPVILVTDLTTDQVRDIFAGNITNWSEVGDVDAPIQVVVPNANSDTRAVFEAIIMGQSGSIVATAIERPTSRSVQNTLSTTPHTIGFLSLSQIDKSALSLLETQPTTHFTVLDLALIEINLLALDGVTPSIENAMNGLYPVIQPLNILTNDEPSELVKSWLEFSLGLEGQQIVLEAGYAPPQ